jgi:hypothetical protein
MAFSIFYVRLKMALDLKGHFLYISYIRRKQMRNAEQRWYSAYQAWKRAQNPKFKAYWAGVMSHFSKEMSAYE